MLEKVNFVWIFEPKKYRGEKAWWKGPGNYGIVKREKALID